MSQTMVLPAIPGSQRRNTFKLEKTKVHEQARDDQPRIVLIDDDPVYGAVIGRWAQLEGLELDVFHSLDHLGFVGLLSQYDIAIVDYDLGDINGKEVADYMTTLFGNKPMLMISGVDRSQEMMGCPSCVKGFMQKSVGYAKILNTALNIRRKWRTEGF